MLAEEKKTNLVDGSMFDKIVYGAIKNLYTNVQIVDDLNVFPIPDGDTGKNMFLTLKCGLDEMKAVKEDKITLKIEALAKGMLLGARGNSGVILSQMFNGVAAYLSEHKYVGIEDFGKALISGVKYAYDAVAKPVEGTMLTVARETCDLVNRNIQKYQDINSFFSDCLVYTESALKRTPELLKVLKDAGVVDSGGAGLYYIVEGICKSINDENFVKKIENFENYGGTTDDIDYSKFNEDSVMTYGYCTETLLQLQKTKIDIDSFSIDDFTDHLKTIGDSIVALQNGYVVKVHVHTMTPSVVLEYCQQFGEFLKVKIENMTLQHNDLNQEKDIPAMFTVSKTRSKFALVTVVSGEGLVKVFQDLGADAVILNENFRTPSTNDFIEAFDKVNAEYIFVLPNNRNYILAAKQAGDLYTKSEIIVVESKDIGQGYSAISMLDYSSDNPIIIAEEMFSSMQSVTTGMITKSIRDAVIDEVAVKNNDYIGFTGKRMLTANVDKLTTYDQLVTILGDQKDYLIVIYGKDVTSAEKREVAKIMAENHSNIEFYEMDGKQATYDFILICE